MLLRTLPALVAALLLGHVQAQLTVTNAPTPNQLVQDVLLGGGVTASNVTYNGQANPPAGQLGRGSFTAVNSNLGLDAGVILSSGSVTAAAGPAANFASETLSSGSDPDLVTISGGNINDRSVLEFDFIPTGDTLRFRYVFGSEEYPSFVCSFNDVFGFFLSGPGIAGPFSNGAINIALLPSTTTPVGIYTVNNGQGNNPNDPFCPAVNPQYYVNNTGGTTVAYNGFTVVLTAFALVECGQTYHIKMAIGDAGDSAYDSGVFLEAGSFTSSGQVLPYLEPSPGVFGNTMLEGCGPFELVFQRLGDLSEEATVELIIGGTATPGVDYVPALPSTIYYAPGQEFVSIFLDVPPDPDGPETVVIMVEQLIQCAGSILQTIFNFTIDSPPPLTVTSNNLNSVCGQVNVLAPTVSGGMGQYSYLWSTGETTPTISVSPGVTTTYSVTVSDICAVEPVTVEFNVTLPIYPPMTISASPPTAIDCLASGPISVLDVTGGNNVFTYQWTLNGVNVGNTPTITVPAGPPTWYVVTVTEGCGSSIQDSVLVTTVPLDPIQITTTGNTTVICTGDEGTVGVVDVVGGNGVYSLTWTNAAGQTVGTNSSITVPVPADQTYTITVQDQCGNIGTAAVSTLTPVYAPFVLSLAPGRTICAGDSILLHAVVNGGSGYYFVDWHDMDFTDPMLWMQPWEMTQYVVTVTDQCGEQRSASATYDVEHVYIDIVVTNRGQDDWYLQAATLPYAETWLWDMGDGTMYRGNEVVHSYLNLEDHWVTLSITTPNGCAAVDSVKLEAPAHLYFPNAFSPDGDGVNDFFGPVGHSISEFEMSIFDRWGMEVFRTTDMQVMWDGRVNGSGTAKTDVYVYKYRAVGHYFPAIEGFGHVTLLKGTVD
ncbi:MAG: choice-of-anchor L domain-containing protein [Flavobacteriales bacterium]|nr:choice-of-anchor L domain-containing protein [Flavobacteriales bacterium]